MPSSNKEQRVIDWNAICPLIYDATETDISRLNPELVDAVQKWTYRRTGLIICGPTRTGKTRAAWMLLRRLYVDEARWIETFTSVSFAHECSERFGSGDGAGEAWIRRLAKADVVFFDDLGKFKMTERVEAELFGLIEDRTSWGRPVIATMNLTGEQLQNILSDNRGEPLVARLREFCDIVTTTR